MKISYVFIIMFLISIAPLLNGCGVKPGFVDPPQGVENDEFPRTYPDPATDADF